MEYSYRISSLSATQSTVEKSNSVERFAMIDIREFKQIATAGATTAAVAEKVWGEYVSAVCQILAK